MPDTKKYRVIAYGDYERRLKRKEVTIFASDEEEAWTQAWKMFCEYKEIGVYEDKGDGIYG